MMTIKYPSPVPTQKAYWTPNSVWHSIDFLSCTPFRLPTSKRYTGS